MMRLVREIDPMPTEADNAPAAGQDSLKPEQPDGVVEDIAEDAGEAGGETLDVNLPAMEALLFSTHHPLTAGRLAELLDLSSTKLIRKAIKALNAQYEESGRSFRVEQVAGGYQMLTLPDFGPMLKEAYQ